MTIDYNQIGFKCGIEIHQQLETHKLFCSCPSLIREEKPDLVVERRMRAVAGELGEVDRAALHEFLKNRRLLYEAYSNSNCLVELDEEPPHPLNQGALEIAVETAFLLKARLVDELQVMRKTVIDGSNTTGFQRTILVAMDGILETSEGAVGIPTICLEEDAARKIEEKGDTIVYRLDRLGIPLVEIATTPDIKNPRHAKEVAEKIGMLLRATGKVKRGLGTIRQDLNVSIRDGSRVEVKGVQALNDIPKILENEVLRQMRLVEIKKELEKRDVRRDDLRRDYVDVSNVFASSGRDWVKSRIRAGEKGLAVKLKGFQSLLGKELMPDYRFGTELARIVKSTTGVGGIMHSDEKIDVDLRKELDRKLETGDQSAFVCVVARMDVAVKALGVVVDRCVVALTGVPEETRMAVGELTEYMRPLPGSHRMYPETDEPLVLMSKQLLDNIKASLPELFEDKAKRYEKMGLSGELASQLSKSALSSKFEEYASRHAKLKPSLIAGLLLMAPKEAKKRFNANVELLADKHYEEILGLLEGGAITKDVLAELLAVLASNPDKKAGELAKEKQLTALSMKEIELLASRVIEENRELKTGNRRLETEDWKPVSPRGIPVRGKTVETENRQQALNILVGKVMGLCKGRADAEIVRKILEKKLG
ncbi:MAG: Glu-tRNA(Gln) amidotransferase subunit GatE [Candidatus Altiarchaeales archaeon]|nr:Glu-tRNA(Gln) amidotransferase subunit GatE [Candidatus Altiarchaeales archaeon]